MSHVPQDLEEDRLALSLSQAGLPRPLVPLLRLAQALRAHGFAVAPDQTISVTAAIGLLGPRDIEDIRAAARALFAIPHEREAEFSALFDAVFLGDIALEGPEGSGEEEEPVAVHDPTGDTTTLEGEEDEDESGQAATPGERLGQRELAPRGDEAALAALAARAPRALPRRTSYRWSKARHGKKPDLRRTLREAVRRDGEVMRLPQLRRKTRQRRILLLIDVSGSMRERSEGSLQLAHVLVQAAERAEVFTLGTRLTRVTPALEVADRERALARVGRIVADIDGGTRLGDALTAYLDVPRFAGFARGAAVVVLSDGLERGDPEALIAAVRRLSRLAWRLDWLTPLAADPGFRPETEALAAVMPMLHSLGDGGSPAAVAGHLLNLARAV